MRKWRFSDDAARRIMLAVRAVERQTAGRQLAPDEPGIGFELRRFELIDDLAPGGTATACRLSEDDEALTEETFELKDTSGHRGRKSGKFSSPHDRGSRGIAFKPHDRVEWEILTMEPAAALVTGLATAAVATSDPTFTIDGVAVAAPPGGLICDQDPAAAMTVQNRHAFALDNNGKVDAQWDEAAENWFGIQGDCPAA